MSLKLEVSNSLNSLADHLATTMELQVLDVFTAQTVVTQTDGMNIWLRMQLAEKMGIASNIHFLKPNDLIFRVYQLLGGGSLNTLTRDNLIWLLYQLMGEDDFLEKFPQQAAYFNLSGTEKDLKRMGLATKLADLFDQYQIYRQEIITQWNELSIGALSEKDWQAFLWIKAKTITQNTIPDKTVVSSYILEKLAKKEHIEKLQRKLPSIYLFGLSIITKFHMEILHALSQVIDVHFYLLNPAPDIYWVEDKNEKNIATWKSKNPKVNTESFIYGNDLLTSWGKVLQDTYRLLYRLDETINSYESINTIEPKKNSLLHFIQNDIYNNVTDNTEKIPETFLQDESISVHTHFTKAREVESLYQYLVHLSDKKKEKFSPRDIVVMVSNIDDYAPYIKAIFENAPYKFKYKIADISVSEGDTIYTALSEILTLTEENFTSEKVMQLLDSSYIRKRFKLNDVERLREIVKAANIRFGINGNLQDDTYVVSWVYGIKRMMYGICMSGEELYGDLSTGFFPLDIVEGAESQHLIRFVHFIEVLMSCIQERKHTRTVQDWSVYILDVLSQLIFLPEDETDEDYIALTEQIGTFKQMNTLLVEKISFTIFSYHFLQTLEDTKRSSLFINDGITFCSLIPMRSIPFKIIALMGLNHDSFPRKEKVLNFNLMQQKQQLGDRNIKDNDKHLFLETILSAKDYLYISYIGKSVNDNTTKPASILVEELLDYISKRVSSSEKNVYEHIVTEHPLHSNSNRYNHENEKLYRYGGRIEREKESLFKKKMQPKEVETEEIPFSALLSFCKNSIKTYYNNALGVYYTQDELLLRETEFFELNSLSKWQIRNELLSQNPSFSIAEWTTAAVKKGLLTLKNTAVANIATIQTEIHPLIEALEKEKNGNEEQIISFKLHIDNSQIIGKIDNIYGDKYIHICTSKSTVREKLMAYYYSLAGIAIGVVNQLVFIQCEHSECTIYDGFIQNISPEEATQRLTILVQYYKKGCKELIPMHDTLYSNWNIVWDEKKIMDKWKYVDHYDEPYLLSEYKNGLFDNPDNKNKFIEAFQVILGELPTIFGKPRI